MVEIGFRVAAASLAIALALTSGVGAQDRKGSGGAPAVRSAPAPAMRSAPAAPVMRSAPAAPPAMRQVAPAPRQFQAAPRQFQAAPRQFQAAPRQFQGAPRQFQRAPRQLQAAPRQMTPRQVAPSQRVAPRFAGPRDGGPKGTFRRDVGPRQGIVGDRGKVGSRAAERRELRRQFDAKSLATKSKAGAGDTARQRAVDRRQQLIESRQATQKMRENIKAGMVRDRTIGARTAGGPDRALVRRGNADRPFALRNRALADRSARTPAARALAQATFGGRFARNWDRRDWRFRHHHHIHVIGWIGPLFWPYAYDDFVDYTFWPYAYDSFWPYAYDDVYEGFFGPYAVGGPAYYAEEGGYAGGGYVSGGYAGGGYRSGPRPGYGPRIAARGPAGGAAMAQICTGETAGLTDWPIERIAQAVNPDDTQRAALNELRDAASRAVEQMRSACPDDLPSTPAGRMAAMRQRLEAMRAAAQIVRPALEKFYDALTDEQKARFNALEPDQPIPTKAGKAELSQVCSAAVTKTNAAPTARIQQALRLSPEQRSALDKLDAATAKAAEMLAANCPTEETLTPPGRLAAMEARLNAMLQALDVVQPALVDFYGSLTDEQKARFNQLGVRRQASR